MTGSDEIVPASRELQAAAPARTAPRPPARWSRRRGPLGVFASIAAVGFLGAYLVPTTAALADVAAPASGEVSLYAVAAGAPQSIAVSADTSGEAIQRDGYAVEVIEPEPEPEPEPAAVAADGDEGTDGAEAAAEPPAVWAPPAVAPDPGSAQAIAHDMVMARGWGEEEFSCLVALWNKESGWRVNALNAGSGAYGIPQSLPGNKMASAGADWETNPATQITWGLGYIQGRYGAPCGAWGHSQATGWY